MDNGEKLTAFVFLCSLSVPPVHCFKQHTKNFDRSSFVCVHVNSVQLCSQNKILRDGVPYLRVTEKLSEAKTFNPSNV